MPILLEKEYKICIFIALSIAIIIFVASSIPSSSLSPATTPFSTVYHFSVFFLLAFFLLAGFNKKNKKILLVIIILISVIYGISDEIHQLFVPGRFFSIEDIFVNSIGSISSGIFFTIIKTRK